MVTYSTNWMGPISLAYYKDNNIPKGIVYSCGRIDIRDDTKHGYEAWHEYGVPPMTSYSWSKLTDFLSNLETEEVLNYFRLIEMFEQMTRHKIEWYEEGMYAVKI